MIDKARRLLPAILLERWRQSMVG